MKQAKNLSLTIGIPTYYGGPALVKAVKTILKSKNVPKFDLIVTVDGNPLDQLITKQLTKLSVKILDNKDRKGQFGRIKQLIKLTKTDLLLLTQDDIIFDPRAIANILEIFHTKPNVTMVGAKVLPTPAETKFEKIVEVGVTGNIKVGENWNNGDNYLLASGRCLAFRTKFVKAFNIPETVINSDAYLYFENKRQGGGFQFASNSIVFNRSPQSLTEHLKQSRKFQISYRENERYSKEDLGNEYKVPTSVKLKVFISQLMQYPLLTPAYLLVNIYTRIAGRNLYKEATRFWDTDVTTKRV